MKKRQAKKIVTRSSQGHPVYSFAQVCTAMHRLLGPQRARIGEGSFHACCRVVHRPQRPKRPL